MAEKDPSVNVLGQPLETCSTAPVTGFWRNGCCDTGDADAGRHTVCAVMTDEFLAMSKYLGNDLSTPRPEYGFKGLKAGDRIPTEAELCAAFGVSRPSVREALRLLEQERLIVTEHGRGRFVTAAAALNQKVERRGVSTICPSTWVRWWSRASERNRCKKCG